MPFSGPHQRLEKSANPASLVTHGEVTLPATRRHEDPKCFRHGVAVVPLNRAAGDQNHD